MFFPQGPGADEAKKKAAELAGVSAVQWKNPWWYPPEDLLWDLVGVYQRTAQPRSPREVEKAVRLSLKRLPKGALAQAWAKQHGSGKPSVDPVFDRAAMVRSHVFFRRLPRTDLWAKLDELGWSPIDKAVATLALLGLSAYSLPDRMRALSTRRNIDPFFSMVIQILQAAGLVPGDPSQASPPPSNKQVIPPPHGGADDGEDGEEDADGDEQQDGQKKSKPKRKQPQGGQGNADDGEQPNPMGDLANRLGLEGEDGWNGVGKGTEDGEADGGYGGHPGVSFGLNPGAGGAPGMGAGNAHLNLEFLKWATALAEALKALHLRYKPAEVRNADLRPVEYPADEMELRPVRGMHERPAIHELALDADAFAMRAAAGMLSTFQHYEDVPHSKRFGMLLDVSGSMSGAPFIYAAASAIMLTRHALKGRHEVVLRLFDAQPYPSLKGQPDRIAAYLMLMPFSSGGTDIGAAVAKMGRDDDPDEIIVISDGDDHKAIKKPVRKDGREVPVHVIFTLRQAYRDTDDYLEEAPIRKSASTFEVVAVNQEIENLAE